MATASNAGMPLAAATLQTIRLHVDDNVVIRKQPDVPHPPGG